MNFRLSPTITVILFLLFSHFAHAQPEEECNLPAPQNLQVIVTPPDIMDVSWDPVPGAISYDVLVVDLSNNQVLYNANELGLTHTINSITPNNNMIVAVAGICYDLTPGDYSTINPLGIHLEDLVIQLNGPQGPQITHTCLSVTGSGVDIDWITMSSQDKGVAQVSIPNNVASYVTAIKTFVMIENQGIRSLMQVNRPFTGGAMSLAFPHQIIVPNFVANTTVSLWYSGGNPVYTVDPTGLTAPNTPSLYDAFLAFNQANLIIPDYYQETIQISELNCFMGIPVSIAGGGDQGMIGGLRAKDQPILPDNHILLETRSPLVLLSPNPTSDILHLNQMPEGQAFHIFDLSGRSWHRGLGTKGQLDVDVSGWPAGTYILHAPASDGKTVITQQFIVQ
ncbi:MAG: T9SS type A sorting domain-containing protein [Bacteroidota bacterium]